MARKPRSDSRLASLNPEQKALLRTWLIDENLSYEAAKDRLHQDFNVETSVGALSQFYATECFALRSSEAKAFAEQVETELLSAEPTFDKATLALVKQKAFERAYAKNGNLSELAILAGIIGDSAKLKLKEKDQQLAERRVALLEKKAAQADAAEGVTRDEALTPEQREAKLKEIFGLR